MLDPGVVSEVRGEVLTAKACSTQRVMSYADVVRRNGNVVAEQLLPGIPDEITINLISLKLPWNTFHELSKVSHSWQQAIQSRQLYDARVRSKSTETLVAFSHLPNDVRRIAFYSMKDDRSYNLPPIPGQSAGIPWLCGCIFLEGNLYVLGGSQYLTSEPKLDDSLSGDEVYVFDVAGQKQWKQCASMTERRGEFGCGIMDSKIYVFGGRNEDGPVRGAEVYDPKDDSWSPITPMPSLGFNQKVTPIGDELFVYDGDFYDSDFVWTGRGDPLLDYDYKDYNLRMYNGGHIDRASSAEIYHPLKDEWRIVKHFSPILHRAAKVMMGGKLYKMDVRGSHIYDVHTRSWKVVQSAARGEPGGKLGHSRCTLCASVVVNDVVLAMVENLRVGAEGGEATFGLVKGGNFGIENTEFLLKSTKCSVSYKNGAPPFMHSFQL